MDHICLIPAFEINESFESLSNLAVDILPQCWHSWMSKAQDDSSIEIPKMTQILLKNYFALKSE